MTYKNHYAFSLVEVSMVILIISILITGISKGIDLYNDMRLLSARKITYNSRVARIPDLIMWLETTMVDSFAGIERKNGGKISSWNDINPISNSKLNFLNFNNTFQPIYIENGIGGIPAVNFSNTQYLESNNFNIGANYTIFIVFNTTMGNIEGATIFSILNSNFQHGVLVAVQPALNMRILHRSPMGSSTQDDNYINSLPLLLNKNYIFSYRRSIEINQSNFYINGGNENYSATSPEFDSNSLIGLIGRLQPTNTRRSFNGNISEIIIYNRYLNNDELNDINLYLVKKFNII
jgi:prepilin-type N-terminal cleavage/methylation domain-containing protein